MAAAIFPHWLKVFGESPAILGIINKGFFGIMNPKNLLDEARFFIRTGLIVQLAALDSNSPNPTDSL
jgi:hypothetical protein